MHMRARAPCSSVRLLLCARAHVRTRAWCACQIFACAGMTTQAHCFASNSFSCARACVCVCTTASPFPCRSLDKVRDFVGIPSALYAGAHGCDIEGDIAWQAPHLPAASDAPTGAAPHVQHLRHCVADEFLPALRDARDSMAEAMKAYPGASVEDNKFSITVHYRGLPSDVAAAIEHEVDTYLERSSYAPQLLKRPGKCIFEVRPNLNWHKGVAVSWILQQVCGAGKEAHRCCVFVLGDDHTDEDMFRAALALEGASDGRVAAFPIVVMQPEASSEEAGGVGEEQLARMPRPTAGKYYLRDYTEVRAFLNAIRDMLLATAATRSAHAPPSAALTH